MCFMTKCPYVPPHEFNLDFPHLMLRYRAVEHRKGKTGFWDRQVAKTDRNGRLGTSMPGLANWATDTGNGMTRGLMQTVAGVDKRAALPPYAGRTLVAEAKAHPAPADATAPAHGRKAVLYATCYGNYNMPQIGHAARKILAKNGVETEILYPECCGMPQLEQGDLADVAARAKTVAASFAPWIEKGYDVIALVPSCALMLKFEWPLIVPGDAAVKALAEATHDLSEYMVGLSKQGGLAEGLRPIEGGVTLHIACHARAQNMGQKAAELLRLIPDIDLTVIERCSGHGGAWGVKKENFDIALKVGKPVARTAAKAEKAHVVSECPLAGMHILQGMTDLAADATDADGSGPSRPVPGHAPHPIELFARAYGIEI